MGNFITLVKGNLQKVLKEEEEMISADDEILALRKEIEELKKRLFSVTVAFETHKAMEEIKSRIHRDMFCGPDVDEENGNND